MATIKEKLESKNSSKTGFQQARFADNYEYIIDSQGKRVEFNDPRIVYIEPNATNNYAKRLTENFYKTRGRNIRFVENTTADTIQYARKICSGRECVPTMFIAGAILKDIYKSRGKDEISIYRLALEQEGPCQNGGWPGLWEIFENRLKIENVIFCGTLYGSYNYIGLSLGIYFNQLLYYILGPIITEARNALQIVAEHPSNALEIFERETDKFILTVRGRKKTLKRGLMTWANEISKIPLNAKVLETPKVLILGGLNLLFVQNPFEEYFLNNSIIPKVVDLTEPTYWVLYEFIMRFNFEKGRITKNKMVSWPALIKALIFKKNRTGTLKAIFGGSAMRFFGSFIKKNRNIIGKTGLLFDEDIPFKSLMEDGKDYFSNYAYNEVMTTVGRFIQSVKSSYYDGLINLGCFNCQPAMNSQAIIRPLANKSEIPYAAIDCEGPWISTNHLRLLETIAVQAKRFRNEKNNQY